jgi:hypothetical protein
MSRSSPLFERCGMCDGTRKTVQAILTRQSHVLPAGSECPCCSTGYNEIGMTDNQLRAALDERDALLEFVERLARVLPVHFHEHEQLKREAARLTEGKGARAAEVRIRKGLPEVR